MKLGARKEWGSAPRWEAPRASQGEAMKEPWLEAPLEWSWVLRLALEWADHSEPVWEHHLEQATEVMWVAGMAP